MLRRLLGDVESIEPTAAPIVLQQDLGSWRGRRVLGHHCQALAVKGCVVATQQLGVQPHLEAGQDREALEIDRVWMSDLSSNPLSNPRRACNDEGLIILARDAPELGAVSGCSDKPANSTRTIDPVTAAPTEWVLR